MKSILAICALLLLAGCDDTPTPGLRHIADSPSGYGDARFMGTVDGCRLWSVNGGQFYFANCRGGVTSAHWSRMVGKVTHHYDSATESVE